MKSIKQSLSGILAILLSVLLFSIYPVAYAAENGSTPGNTEGQKLMAGNLLAATAPTTLWVAPTETNGIPAQIDAFKSGSGTSLVYQIYLPGNVERADCFLSWDGGLQATVDNVSYESGSCPVPPANTQKNYSFKNGTTTTTFKVITYQGSPNVQPFFIDIDESGDNPSITEMDGDANHEVTCTGRINIGGEWLPMPKIKGRGNYTWKMSKDKRAYNITLANKINIDGIESDPTKKWSILSEVGDHSLMCNRSGFHLANQLGIGQDTTSADVWMNGEYQGCYTVTPKYDSFVSKSGYLIEEDNYQEPSVADGGDPQFALDGLNGASSGGDGRFNLITVKAFGDNLLMNNGMVDESPENMEAAANAIRLWLQDAWDAIRSSTGYNSKNKYYTDYIDIESFAKMYLMQEYVKSYDVCAGSILFHRDGQSDSDKLIAGPIWDLDNAMGSVQSNSGLGSVGDRRSGKGAFITQLTEYKTSIYKNLYTKHEDFRNEVTYQYNKYKSAFAALPTDVQQMTDEIADSAKMNHNKVSEISNYNLHKYSTATTLEQNTEYQQKMLATTNSKTDWANYAANLKSYITARSLWFANTYYDSSFVDPENCTHDYQLISEVPATCTSAGSATYKCPICRDTYTEAYPKIAHNYQDGVCTVCGENLINVAISCSNGASVTVYETQNLNGAHVDNATNANPRDGDTGLIDCSGEGQVNFVVNVAPGYELVSVTAAPKNYKNLKLPADTGIENGYRITKVSGDFTITVTAQCTHDWGEPTYEWADDHSSVTATRTCARCNESETEIATTTSQVTKEATCTEKGETTFTSDAFENTAFAVQTTTVDNIAALGHDWGEWAVTTEPTCTEKGIETRSCSRCGSTETREVDTLGHDWGDSSYEWAADHSSVTATRACKHDPSHVETETASANAEVAKPATCTEMGETTYTSAAFENEAFDVQTITAVDIPVLGHDWDEPTYEWSEDLSSVVATRVCERDATHVETETASTTAKVTKPATCEDKGETTYTSGAFENNAFAVQTIIVANIPALGHDWADPTYEWAAGHSSVTATRACKRDASHVEAETVSSTSEVTKPATCTEKGITTYTSKAFENTAFSTQTEAVTNVDALGHAYESVVTAPTCTAGGYTTHTCSRCGNSYVDAETDALGHDWSDWTVTKDPTCTEAGAETRSCSRCGSTETREVEALGHDWGDSSYEWADDHSGVTATRSCGRCDESETEAATAASEVTKPATCTEKGEATYTSDAFENNAFAVQTKIVADIPALGHDWADPTYEWAAGHSSVTATRACKRDASHVETETVSTTSEVSKPATCTEKGETTYTSAAFENAAFAVQAETVADIPALGHEWGEPLYTWAEDHSDVTATHVCAHDATHIETETVAATAEATKPATCTEKGETTYTSAAFENSAFAVQAETREIEALGHDYETTVIEPTEQEGGYTLHHCSRCDDEYKTDFTPSIADATAADAVNTQIVDLPDLSNITPNDSSAIAEAREAFENLTEEQKELIDEDVIETLETAEVVVQLVGLNASSITLSDAATVTSARAKFNTLNAAQKAQVPEAAMKKLIAAEARIEELKAKEATEPEPSSEPEKSPEPKKAAIPETISGEISPSNPVAASTVAKQIASATSDADQKGSTFGLLQARGVAKSATKIKLTWKKIPGATSYAIYGNKCGKTNKYKFIKTVKGAGVTLKKLKKGTYYKYLIVALNGDTALATSKTIHVATKGGKVGNAKSVKITAPKKSKTTLSVGKTVKIKAKTIALSTKLKIRTHRGIAFETSNASIATVNKKGIVKAKAKGTCYIYAYTQNGRCAKIKITVK